MTKEELKQRLFTGHTNVFAILDGASVENLRMRLYEMDPPNYCLFRGELEPDVASMAPYLVGLIDGTPFTEWVLSDGFGKHWGVFAQSKQSITEMRKHFRALITVHDETGTPMLFRFYDPRVLQQFLPTCNPGELKTFFGKVDVLFAENADGETMSSFTIEGNDLKHTDSV
jgi:hypothetical protein